MKRIKILTVSFAAMFCASVAVGQTAADVQKKYNDAVELLKGGEGNYAKVVVMMEEVVKEGTAVGPDAATEVTRAKQSIPELYYQLARIAGLNKQLDQAEIQATKSYNKAKEYRNRTWELKAEDMLAKVYLAQAGPLLKNKQYAQASAIYEKGLKAIPNSPVLENHLATSYLDAGRKDDGFAVLNRIIQKSQSDPRYKRTAEQAKSRMENYENKAANDALAAKNYTKAISLLNDIIKNNPKNALAQMMLIQAFASSNREDDVISKGPAAAAMQTDAKNKSDIFYMIGVSYFNKQQNDKALENLKKVTTGNSVQKAKALIKEIEELGKK